MDIKLKSIKGSLFLKCIVFFLIVGVTATLLVQTLNFLKLDFNVEMLFENNLNYVQSTALWHQRVFPLIMDLKSGKQVIQAQNMSYFYKSHNSFISNAIFDLNETPDEDAFWIHVVGGVVDQETKARYDEQYLKQLSTYLQKQDTLIIKIDAPAFAYQKALWEWEMNYAKSLVIAMTFNALALLALISFAIYLAGPGINTFDRLYSELTMLGFILGPSVWAAVAYLWIRDYYHPVSETALTMSRFAIVLTTSVATAWTGVFMLSIVRKLKSKHFFKTSLFYKLCAFMFRYLKKGILWLEHFDYRQNKSAVARLVGYHVRYVSISALIVGIFFFATLQELVFLLLFSVLAEICVTIWFFWRSGKSIMLIDHELEDAIALRLNSEHMKIELITNMSHDLKTPLTSIISYVDLLKRDETINEEAKEYIQVIDQKSHRLNQIVTDLFDLSKSTTGNLTLTMEPLDLNKMVQQVIASYSDELESKKLLIKLHLPEQATIIVADGARLFRVFQNLMDNIINYALESTRVYIDLTQGQGLAKLVIKNTSANEISFTAEEALQRFSRGDAARSTDGSGLGLSIAESFTRVCGGEFSLSIDGDLFKTELSFPCDNEGTF